MLCERHQGDEQWLKQWMFTDDATFHVSDRVNTHNSLIWGTENPHVYGPFFLEEESDRAVNYLDMIEQYVVPQSHHYLSTGWRSTALGYHSEGKN